jgi:hypothetical protein
MGLRSRRGTGGSRYGGITDRFSMMDRTTFAIIAAAATLILAIFFPRLYPAARRGPECSSLAAPLGGNNRSVLAQVGGDQQVLEIELVVEDDIIDQNGPLKVNATFVNKDIGPIILYLPRDRSFTLLRPDQTPTGPGLTFEITQVGQSYTRGNQSLPDAPAAPVEPDELHLLGSRARCTEHFELNASTLINAGVQAGQEYRIRAFYRNKNPGIWRFDEQTGGTPTPTPAYSDQGIWTGDISSQEILFRVQAPGAPP